MAICNCPDTYEHRISCENHPENKPKTKRGEDVSEIGAYHVLAKITYGVGPSARVEQRHFFVMSQSHENAIRLARAETGIEASSVAALPEIQYTVKAARLLAKLQEGHIYAL